jgi:D-alanyl-lipoteichoic acid acyltransferase DltB (MBOAT superfamily)
MMHDNSAEQVQHTIATRLLFWAGLSVTLGATLKRMRHPFWRGIGFQFVIWGAVNGLIALIAGRIKPPHQTKENILIFDQENQKKKSILAIVLWINTILDLIYIIGGFWVYRSKGASNPYLRGQGTGITIQGGYLFLFDLVHAIWLLNPKH